VFYYKKNTTPEEKGMRGNEYSIPPRFFFFDADSRIPQNHPLREMKNLIDPILQEMSPFFDKLYSDIGRPSIPPEQLLRALVLQALHTIRSERFLMEQIDLHLAYRWFVGLSADEPVWDPTTFTKNRDRLLEQEVSQEFFDSVRKIIEQYDLASDEHFSVDGTQLEAWASLKSFQQKGEKGEKESKPPSDNDPGNPSVDFRGEKRCNDTHESKTDPNCRLSRKGKGKEAKLCYQGAVLAENRHGLVMQAKAGIISGTSEREMAVELVDRERECQRAKTKRMTVGGDKAFDVEEHTEALRKRNVTNHAAQREDRSSSIDGRTTRNPGYAISQRKRKRVEEVFGWGKTVGSLRKLLYRGDELVNWIFVFRMAVYNLVRIRNILRESSTA
jgi:transposase